MRAKVAANGRLVIPAECRKAAGIEGGGDVVVRVVDGEIRIRSLRAAVAEAQEVVRRYFPEEERLSDRLIAERRAEADRD